MTKPTYLDFHDPKTDADRLAAEISRISESLYCAGWLGQCEFFMWSALTDGERTAAFGEERGTEGELMALAQRLGGWPYWEVASPISPGPVLLPMNEWLPLYDKWLARERKYGKTKTT